MKQASDYRRLNWAIAQTIVFVALAYSRLFDCLLYFFGRNEYLLLAVALLLLGEAGTAVGIRHIHKSVQSLLYESHPPAG